MAKHRVFDGKVGGKTIGKPLGTFFLIDKLLEKPLANHPAHMDVA